MQEIGKVGISQESGGETLSKYAVPGRNQGTNDIQCVNEPSKEGAFLGTASRKVCQHDQELNSVTGNHSSGGQRSMSILPDTPKYEEKKQLASVLERVAYLDKNMLTVMKAHMSNASTCWRS